MIAKSWVSSHLGLGLQIATAIVFILCIGLNQSMAQESIDDIVIAQYKKEWASFLKDFRKGEEITSARKKLPSQVLLIGSWDHGGSGTKEWIFRIDDYYELAIVTDRDDKLLNQQWIQRRKKWLCFPNGRISAMD